MKRIKSKEFLKDAPTTPAAQVHINHKDCPAGEDTRSRLYIKRLPDNAVLAYCHNCGLSGVYLGDKKVRKPNLKELKLSLLENDERDTEIVEFPEGTEFVPKNFPAAAAAWLYKYRLTDADIQHYNIGYNGFMDRIILPIYDGGDLIGWQGRSLNVKENPPKYINRNGTNKSGYFIDVSVTNNRIFVVEDIISAIRIAQYDNVVALCGTHLSTETLARIGKYYKKAIIYFDPDLPGIKAAKEAERKLSLVVETTDITTLFNKQPKELSNKELEEMFINISKII